MTEITKTLILIQNLTLRQREEVRVHQMKKLLKINKLLSSRITKLKIIIDLMILKKNFKNKIKN